MPTTKSPPAASSDEPAEMPAAATSQKSAKRFIFAAIVAVCWFSCLGYLVVTTANPPQIHRNQFRTADRVVVVSLADSDRWNVIAELTDGRWSKAQAGESITLITDDRVLTRRGDDVRIAAIQKAGAGWEVVPIDRADGDKFRPMVRDTESTRVEIQALRP